MRRRRRIAGLFGVLTLLLGSGGGSSSAGADLPPHPAPQATPQRARPHVPAGLPRYAIDARLDLDRRLVTARQRVEFTNRSEVEVRELVFHVYPRYRVADGDRMLLIKTLEMLRLSPEEAMDAKGRRLEIAETRDASGRPLTFRYDPTLDTILTVELLRPVAPGEVAAIELHWRLELPEQWGRWCHYKGVTSLVNWYPVLAHHDARGWERTPFVPWHQPWHQEAGHYDVRLDLPIGQTLASTGSVVSRVPAGQGRERVTIAAGPARDFAFVCSARFAAWERQCGPVRVRVVAPPECRTNAERVLEYAAEVIPLYERWFGPCPDDELEYAQGFFGWNGNECSGLVLLDERIFRLPQAGHRYLDHLVTHETCHQWWWNVVGTDGYAETFMDEGLVNCFTATRLDAKYGRNAPVIVWPQGLGWLPTIGREDLRLSGYYGWRAKGSNGPVIQDIKAMKNLEALFSLAYDRGGKVVGMIRNRLGEERFFAFFRHVYARYSFETFRYADLKSELADFDPEGDWPRRLDAWLLERSECDWSVARVETAPGGDGGTVSVLLRQSGDQPEPTVVLCRAGDSEVRVPIWPERGDYDVPGGTVRRLDDGHWRVELQAPATPTQVEVDPDHALLDSDPSNNRWKSEVPWRLTPLLTPLDTASRFQPFDRPAVAAGPFIDEYARGGFKVAYQKINEWSLSAWAGGEPSLREAIFGGQATLFHVPAPWWSVGAFYEEGLYHFNNDQRHSGGRLFLRYRLIESASFLLDDPGFVEAYYGFGNEFWPGDDGRPVNGTLAALGIRGRLNTLFPYWDPVGGRLLEASVERGIEALGSDWDYTRMTAEWAIVRPLPEGWGYASRTRLGLRAYGGASWPDSVPTLRLGGGRRLRALNLGEQEGSAVWLLTVEWRFPLWEGLDWSVLDHVLSTNRLSAALFYDVGQSYFQGDWRPVIHGVGGGLRLDVTLFSFLERANLRLDIAQAVGLRHRSPVVWFGLNQVF